MGSRFGNEYDVFFVDFGDQEWVIGDKIILVWSSIFQIFLQVVECFFGNVQVSGR